MFFALTRDARDSEFYPIRELVFLNLKLTRTPFILRICTFFSLHLVVVASRFRLLLRLRMLCPILCFADMNSIECLLLNNKKYTEFGI